MDEANLQEILDDASERLSLGRYSNADAAVHDLVAEVRRLTAALAAARREGAEGMRQSVVTEIHAAFHYNDPPDDGVERPIPARPGSWEAHQTLRKLLLRVCALTFEGTT